MPIRSDLVSSDQMVVLFVGNFLLCHFVPGLVLEFL